MSRLLRMRRNRQSGARASSEFPFSLFLEQPDDFRNLRIFKLMFGLDKAAFVPVMVFGDETMVNVSKEGQVFRCEICGNVVVVKEAGGGELVCCGEPMQLEA